MVASKECSSSCCRCITSDAIGLRNRTVPFAYRLVRFYTGSAPMGCNKPAWVAMSRSLYNGSIARMNSIDESGSPYRSPLPCLMGLLASPLRRIHDDVLLHTRAKISLHLCPNPNCSMISSKYSHCTLSKAFVMLNLRNNIDILE
jgi:hypothetical protein